jgi:glycosyltransferase involved in cell wall biosynthesis
MREVLIDVTRLLDRRLKGRIPTGVDRVNLEYIDHFSQNARAIVRYKGRSLLFSASASQRLFAELLHPSAQFKRVITWLVTCASFKLQNNKERHDLFLFNVSHSGLEQASYPKQLRQQKVKPIFVVHDLIPITHPEYCRAGEADLHKIRMNNVLQLASGIVTNSQNTLDELTLYAHKTKQRIPPAVAAPLAAAALPKPDMARPIETPYFLILGTIEARKNHWLPLQVWRKLIEQLGENAPKLVLIGQRGWECENVIDLLERSDTLRTHVIELSSCTDTELSTYITHAQALLFPSFVEGYGLPLMEALSLGVPVIASDLSVFREIAGDIPDYLDPLDGMAWLSRIKSFSDTESTLRTAQLSRLTKFVTPTWKKHFELVEDMMREL